jgi:hypothetical protein
MSQQLKISHFKGVNLQADATLIDNNSASKMLNMQLDSVGTLQRFLGYERAIPSEVGINKPCFGLFHNPTINKLILSTDSKLYSFTDGVAPVLLYSGVALADMKSFFMNNKQYFMDGTNFLQFDGATVINVESNAYVPTLTMGRGPTGGGSSFEAFNLLQPKFKDSFSATTATAYTLSLSGLDATPVTATLNGIAKVETTDFTVNRTTGVVTFLVAPTAGTNNLVIQASKTVAGYAEKIKNCKFFVVFGGSNDTRVFMSGNPNFKNWDFRSGLLDPSYFPDTGFTKVGSDVTSIKGYSKQFSSCVIFKEDSNEDSTIYMRSYLLKDDGTVTFPIVQGNASIGVKASNSIQIVEDSPLFLSNKGVYKYTGGNVKEEMSMKRMSDYVEPDILNEPNPELANSFDYDGKYGINFPSGNTYVFDYKNKFSDSETIKYEAYLWDGIYANSFLEVDSTLYFCDSRKGLVYKLLKPSDLIQYQYDGESYESYWYGKIFSFDADNYKKLVERIDFTLSPTGSRNSAELWIKTNKKEETFIKEYRITTFDFNNIDFDDFDFLLSSFPQPFGKKVKAKKIIYFQPIFKCSKANEGMTINNITLQYILQSPIR